MTRIRPQVVLMLPGQGSQHPGMAHELYYNEPLFAGYLDQFFDRCGPEGHLMRRDWLCDNPAISMDDASRSQPMLFAIAYAIGKMIQGHGVRIRAAIGHSVGELTAAALAGVWDEEAGARVMMARSRAMTAAPPGGMVAVGASAGRLQRMLRELDPTGTVAVGAQNSPLQTVICGPERALARTCAALRELGLPGVRVPACQPFHSPAVSGAAVQFTRAIAAERLSVLQWPIYSTRTGAMVRPIDAEVPAFWGDQLARPVLFWPALDRLLTDHPDAVLVETGPGQVLTAIAKRHPAVRSRQAMVLSVLPGPKAKPGQAWDQWRRTFDALLGRIENHSAAA